MRHEGRVRGSEGKNKKQEKALMLASVASMIDQFNLPNIRLMLDMGYEVHVACNFKEGNTCDSGRVRALRKTLHELGVVCHQWDCPRKVCPISRCWKAYAQLWRIIRQQFAWMHCHSPIGGAIARVVAHQAGVPVIYTAHGLHFYQGAPLKNWLLYYPVEKCLARWTDVLITVNKEDYSFAKKHLKAGKVCHIPGVGVDLEKFQRQEPDMEDACDRGGRGKGCRRISAHGRKGFCRKYRIPEDATVLLSVGELSRRKNHKAILKALAGIPGQDAYYIICGQGACRGTLTRLAKRLGVAWRVRMIGFEENVVALYQNADIFVFPSLQEGMPVALMEAMAAGMPCIVSDVRGNRELIGNQEVRFRPGKPEELNRALGMLMENKWQRAAYGEYNAKKIQPYSLAVVQKRMDKIYSSFK